MGGRGRRLDPGGIGRESEHGSSFEVESKDYWTIKFEIRHNKLVIN